MRNLHKALPPGRYQDARRQSHHHNCDNIHNRQFQCALMLPSMPDDGADAVCHWRYSSPGAASRPCVTAARPIAGQAAPARGYHALVCATDPTRKLSLMMLCRNASMLIVSAIARSLSNNQRDMQTHAQSTICSQLYLDGLSVTSHCAPVTGHHGKLNV